MTTRTPRPNPPVGYVPILGDVGDHGEVRLYPGARQTLDARGPKRSEGPQTESPKDLKEGDQ